MKKQKSIMCLIMVILCLLAGCGSKGTKIDEEAFQAITNDYQAVDEEASYWHLHIGKNEEDKPYLSIYDNAAGNPGVEGEIISLSDSAIVIKVDPDYYEALPSSQWELSKDNLEVTYEVLEDGIELINHDSTVVFRYSQD